jgi:ABC-type multidrug transport system fused ATPase/permease subunit
MEQLLLASQGLVLVSHRLDELSLCDRVVVLGAGAIIEDGSPATLMGDPASAFNAFLRAAEQRRSPGGSA